MTIELKLDENTAAVRELTAEMKKRWPAVAGAATTTAAASTKGADKPPAPSVDEIKAKAKEVRDRFDAETAKGIILKVGGKPKSEEVPEGKRAAVLTALQAKLDEPEAPEGDGDDL